jgi:predicted Zn-dependent protease
MRVAAQRMSMEAALEELDSGDPAGALDLLNAAPADPANAKHLLATGIIQLANNCAGKALPALRGAVALGETAPATLLNLALAEHQAGDTSTGLRLMRTLERSLPRWG